MVTGSLCPASLRPARLGGLALLVLALAGCSLPRGAGFEREILAAKSSNGEEAPVDFSVEPVTRDRLALYESWPRPGDSGLSWISAQPEPPNRVINPGDRLTVTLWNTEENSLLTPPGQRSIALQNVTVSAAGSVFMPYIGDVRVAGQSPERARETLEGRFSEIAPSAQIQLDLVEGSESQVSLLGGVGSPGSYPLVNQGYTVLSLIAEAGGVQASLVNPQIRLMREGRMYGTSIDRLFADPSLDTTLRGGDRVLVEADERFFLALGATGRETVQPFTRDTMTAIEAISVIGGINDTRGNPQGLLVLRDYPSSAVRQDGSGPPHARVVFTLDLTTADGLFSAGDFRILSGDLVYATESPVTATQTIVGILGSSLGVVRQIEGN